MLSCRGTVQQLPPYPIVRSLCINSSRYWLHVLALCAVCWLRLSDGDGDLITEHDGIQPYMQHTNTHSKISLRTCTTWNISVCQQCAYALQKRGLRARNRRSGPGASLMLHEHVNTIFISEFYFAVLIIF